MRTQLLCLLAALWLAAGAGAQPISTARGTVKDEAGNPVPFASVQQVGARGNTVSGDANGQWAIRLALPARVILSATGFAAKTVEIRTADSTGNLFVLHRVEGSLETVVVVGAGIRRVSREMGYAVSSVKAESISGRTPGLALSRASAHTRGATSAGVADSSFVANAAISYQLTAGEVCDFKKWKLWGDYSAGDFKASSENWSLSFRKRYCLMAQTSAHRALVNEPVYLVDAEKGDTVWAAYTDNTGKAELWADFWTGATARLQLHCSGEMIDARPFAEGLNSIVAGVPCRSSQGVDIAFVVDATGSMSDEIRYLQAELGAVIGETVAAHPGLELRNGAVFYRDHGDAYLTRTQPLTGDTNSLLRFIRRQEAGGGGDGPEAVEEALRTAFDSLGWSAEARSRVLFLVLDAPPHERDREKMKSLASEAARRGIRIVPVVCSGADKTTEYLMRCLALATNGTYACLTDDSGIGGAHLKPTTDDFKVELLADLLKRIISEMCFTEDCAASGKEAPVQAVAASEKLKIYPNPARDHVFIESAADVQEAYLADFTGKLLQRVIINRKGRCRINLDSYPSGTYLLRYFTAEKGWGSEKIVVLR